MFISEQFLEEKKKQESYQEFFASKLKQYGVNSPQSLSTSKRKKFFNEVDKEWTAKKETD